MAFILTRLSNYDIIDCWPWAKRKKQGRGGGRRYNPHSDYDRCRRKTIAIRSEPAISLLIVPETFLMNLFNDRTILCDLQWCRRPCRRMRPSCSCTEWCSAPRYWDITTHSLRWVSARSKARLRLHFV